MSGIARHFKRKNDKPVKRSVPQPNGKYMTFKEMDSIDAVLRNEASEQAIYIVMMAAVEVLWHDFGQLQKKNTRLKNFAELLQKRLNTIDDPDELQKEAEKEFEKQTQWSIVRP